MKGIRAFARQDVSAVADLWLKAYRSREPPAPKLLLEYFDKIYFQNPWSTPASPSYVYQADDGRILGFVALFPRPMSFSGKPIQVAVLSTIMVDPGARGQSIGFELMQQAFAGPQDLLITDGANDACRKLWEAAGGDVCLAYGCNWVRILRPCRDVVRRARSRSSLRWLAAAVEPLATALDASAVRMSVGPYRLASSNTVGKPASDQTILERLVTAGRGCALSPVYDPRSLGWILEDVAQAKRRGELVREIVTDASGRELGWYLYFCKPGGMSHVLHLGGGRDTIRLVLLHLFHHAHDRGAIAVSGRLEPRFVSELSGLHCGFVFPLEFLAHTRDEALRGAIHRGDTSLSRLDGEWWMHFADGPWV